jgi:hypothetical protein
VETSHNNSVTPALIGPQLSTSMQCDTAFSGPTPGNCVATSGQSATETLNMEGPSAATDTSPSFSSVVTWTAVS